MPQTITHIEIENIDNYLLEIDEAEESLRLLANLCHQQESTDFLDPRVIKFIGDFLFNYLDRTSSARHYFLKLELGERLKEYGIAGELKKQQLKHSCLS